MSFSPVIRVLGPITLGPGRQPGSLGANALLALALARSTTLTAAGLAQAVWPDDTPTTRQPLQTLISRLRAAGAGEVLATVPGGYRLLDAPTTVDLAAATAAAASARAALAARDAEASLDLAGAALRAWREPLGGGATNPELLEELTRRAGRLEAQLHLVRAEAHLAARRSEQGLAELESTGLATSQDDRFVAVHMRMLLDLGRTTEALDRFASHRAWVREVLGAAPAGELVELNSIALGGSAARPGPAPYVPDAVTSSPAPGTLGAGEAAPHTIPAATTRLIGREGDVAAVAGELGDSRLVSIVGVGGLGKTRLAYEVASRHRDKVAVLELAGVRTEADVELAAVAAVTALDPALAAERARPQAQEGQTLAALVNSLARTPTLLVVDNCEHVLGAAGRLVAALLAQVPTLTVLCTSRSPLGVAGEQVYPLDALASLTGAGEPGPAAAMFAQRARSVRPGVVLDMDAVVNLTRHLDGLPLAIELAAARVRSMSVDEITRRLTDRFALLTMGDPAAPARHQTLRAVIDWSWDLLTASQARLARYLAAFPASFDADAAVTLALSPEVSDGVGNTALGLAVLDDLDALVGHSLVQVFESPDTAGLRYRMVETVKDYCLERGREAGEEAAIRTAMARWARHLSRRLVQVMVVPGTSPQGLSVRAEEDNLLAAFRAACAHGDAATATAVFGSLGTWLSLQGSLFELHELGFAVLGLLEEGGIPQGVEAECVLTCSLLGFVDSLAPTGHTGLIGRLLRDALAARGWVPPAVRFVARLVQAAGDPRAAARVNLEGARDPDPAVRCTALMLDSSTQENAGQVEYAIELGKDAYRVAEAGRLVWLRAVCAQMLGGLYSELGVPDQALEWIRRARRDLEHAGQRAASLDITQIEVLGALRSGDARRAQALLEGWRTSDEARGPETSLVMEMTEAEVEMASGDTAAGLARFAATLERARGEQDLAGPWWLIGESAYVAALCHAGQAGSAQALSAARDVLGVVAHYGQLTADPARTDHPVVGTVAAAVGAWLSLIVPDAVPEEGLPGRGALNASSGPELLALAGRLSSRQDMLTLDRERLWALVGERGRAGAQAAVAELGPTQALARAMEVMGQVAGALGGAAA